MCVHEILGLLQVDNDTKGARSDRYKNLSNSENKADADYSERTKSKRIELVRAPSPASLSILDLPLSQDVGTSHCRPAS